MEYKNYPNSLLTLKDNLFNAYTFLKGMSGALGDLAKLGQNLMVGHNNTFQNPCINRITAI